MVASMSSVCQPLMGTPALPLPTNCLTSLGLGSFRSWENYRGSPSNIISIHFKRVRAECWARERKTSLRSHHNEPTCPGVSSWTTFCVCLPLSSLLRSHSSPFSSLSLNSSSLYSPFNLEKSYLVLKQITKNVSLLSLVQII